MFLFYYIFKYISAKWTALFFEKNVHVFQMLFMKMPVLRKTKNTQYRTCFFRFYAYRSFFFSWQARLGDSFAGSGIHGATGHHR